MAESPEKFVIKCKCGGKFRVPTAARGRRIRCPKCAGPIAIPEAHTTAIAKPRRAPVAKPVDEGGLLNALAGHEASAQTANAVAVAINACPNCTTPFAPAAVVCVNCGYNLRTGQLMGKISGSAPTGNAGAAAKSLGGAAAGAAGAAARSAGQFGIAVGLSAAGAFLGGLVWYLLAINVGIQLGFVAVLVGILAGIGMMMGTKRPTALGAIIAVFLALSGIFGAKFAIGTTFAASYRAERSPEEDPNRQALTRVLTNRAFEAKNIPIEAAKMTPAGKDPMTYKPVQAASETGDSMSAEEFDDLLNQETVYSAKLNEIERQVLDMPLDEVKRQVAEIPEAMAMVKVIETMVDAVGVLSVFELFDIVWFFIAGSAAWKTATASSE